MQVHRRTEDKEVTFSSEVFQPIHEAVDLLQLLHMSPSVIKWLLRDKIPPSP
jgi:hypothetical protein